MVTKAKNLWEFKENLGKNVKDLSDSLGTVKLKNDLFRVIIKNPEYQELRKVFLDEKISKREKEKLFQEVYAKAKELNPALIEDDFRKIINGEIESQETSKKSLEFEKETFYISSEGREEVTKESVKNYPILKKFLDKGIKVKANATWDVIEYMEDKIIDGEVRCKKWEQIFITYDAFIREVCKVKNCSQEIAEKKYLMTIDELEEKMKDKPSNSEEYKKFFNEEINGHLAGYWHPDNQRFDNIGVRSSVWLVGGNIAYFAQHKWHWNRNYRNYGFSGRLLKSA